MKRFKIFSGFLVLSISVAVLGYIAIFRFLNGDEIFFRKDLQPGTGNSNHSVERKRISEIDLHDHDDASHHQLESNRLHNESHHQEFDENVSNKGTIEKLVNHSDSKKSVLCEEGYTDHSCHFKLGSETDIESLVLGPDGASSKMEEALIVLQSDNYNEVMAKVINNIGDNVEKSEKLRIAANELAANIDFRIESAVACGERLCAFDFKYQDNKTWRQFESEYFNTSVVGNMFVLPMGKKEAFYQQRVLVVLGEGNSVIQ